MKEKFRLL